MEGFCLKINQFTSNQNFEYTLFNDFFNLSPNKLFIFNDKDSSWMSEYLIKKIKWCNKKYAEYFNENNESDDCRM